MYLVFWEDPDFINELAGAAVRLFAKSAWIVFVVWLSHVIGIL